LDISKAFDKVSHYALYTKLLERNIPNILVDVLISWYSKCYACVKWDGAMSSFFKIPAGVRQGGVLSPILFSIYMEILLKDLRKSRKGCIMKGQYLGCIMYADDILLLSQSVSTMQDMLNICAKNATDLDLSFNVNKSAIMRIGPRFKVPIADLQLQQQTLTKVSEIKYLGVYIASDRLFKCSVQNSKLKFYKCFNTIFHRCKSSESELICIKLLKSYCLPLILYASEAVHPSKTDIAVFNRLIKNAVGKIFGTFDNGLIEDVRYNVNLGNIGDMISRRQARFEGKYFNKKFVFVEAVKLCNSRLLDYL